MMNNDQHNIINSIKNDMKCKITLTMQSYHYNTVKLMVKVKQEKVSQIFNETRKFISNSFLQHFNTDEARPAKVFPTYE